MSISTGTEYRMMVESPTFEIRKENTVNSTAQAW